MGIFKRLRHWGLKSFHGGPVRFETDIPFVCLVGDRKITGSDVRVRSVADRVQFQLSMDGTHTIDVQTARRFAEALLAASDAIEQKQIYGGKAA